MEIISSYNSCTTDDGVATLMLLVVLSSAGDTFSSRLVHKFSDKLMLFWEFEGKSMTLPKCKSVEHMKFLGSQKQLVFSNEGRKIKLMIYMAMTWVG